MISKVFSSFNKLWFYKKQLNKIARGVLLHEVLCFSGKHSLLPKVHSVNRKPLCESQIRELGGCITVGRTGQ